MITDELRALYIRVAVSHEPRLTSKSRIEGPGERYYESTFLTNAEQDTGVFVHSGLFLPRELLHRTPGAGEYQQ